MKIIAIILILGAIGVTMDKNPILALIYIGLGVFLLKKYKYQEWLPKRNKSQKQQKKELKRVEKSKIDELNNKKAFRKFNVKGVTYENRQQLLDMIVRKYGPEGVDRIQFTPEPDNKYDSNAIKVIFDDIGHIGYIPKERAADIVKLLDENICDIKWNVDYIFNEDDDDDIAYMEIRLYKHK